MPIIKILNHRQIALRSGASLAALVLGCAMLLSSVAFADPSITYTGSVSPAPPAGFTDWNWAPAQVLVVGDNGAGTLDIRGGATASGDT
ncbi:hypothetical protein ACI0FS_02730, partial [Ochrobactrum quorumnocens]|uniref:hypothetical protein n=1 Tax=Ochrobactrum quorumnocens TaxID=271865 RepID=UPI0038528D5C